jgi:AcrR family transcriptional regulator
MSKTKLHTDTSTEEKIREAARKVFTRKGYAATRTRDIAEESGINLALLNYYFRSKEKLFEEVMLEKVQEFFGTLSPIVNDTTTKLEVKVELIVCCYIDMMTKTPDLPIFILSEIRKKPAFFGTKIPVKLLFQQSSFIKQLREKREDLNPIHFLMSLLGMTVFPFVAQPLLTATGLTNEKEFSKLMAERKKLVPLWIKAILKTK